MSRPPAWVEQRALDTAKRIEDEFAKGHLGGVVQRRAALQLIVTDAMVSAIDSATADGTGC